MHKWARGLFGAALVLFALYGVKELAVPPVVQPPRPKVVQPPPLGNQFEMEVIRLTNIERNRRGLRSLNPSPNMMVFSRNWSKVQAGSRMHHSHGPYGENVAVGQSTPQEVLRAWMNSPGHRRNILSSRYQCIGVGYVVDGRGRAYWTQTFQ